MHTSSLTLQDGLNIKTLKTYVFCIINIIVIIITIIIINIIINIIIIIIVIINFNIS